MPQEDYVAIRAEQEQPAEFVEGFGLKAIIGGLFVAFLVLPGAIFMYLMMGVQLGTAAVWVTLIVFLEIAKRCRAKLSRQEMYVIFIVASGVLALGINPVLHLNFAWMQYFIRSDAAHQFEVVNRLPYWLAPPPGSEAYAQRTLLHADWLPLLGLMAVMLVWTRLSTFTLGYAMFRLTSDVEKLPFPLAPIAAQGIMALAESEEETWRWRCFTVGSTIGIAFGLIYVGVPTISGIFVDQEVFLIPIPFIDFTKHIQELKFLRAVPLALFTDLGLIFLGFVLPFWMVAGSFVGGVLARLVGNPILYHIGMLKMWEPGMDYIETNLANTMDFWLSFTIGALTAIFLVGVYTAVRQALAASREIRESGVVVRSRPRGRGDIPVTIAILLYVAMTSWLIMLSHHLVPRFPLWILVGFGFVYTPVLTYVTARLRGLAGQARPVPFVTEATFLLSGYRGVDIWYAPIPMTDASAGVQQFRVCELTGTKFTSRWKAEFFMVPVGVCASLFFWSFIYKMSEIPEDYPWAMRFWGQLSVLRAFWMTATTSGNAFFLQAFKWKVVGVGLTYGLGGYIIMRLLGAPTLFLYGTITGMSVDPLQYLPMFIAALVGRFYMVRIFGQEKWRRYTPILAAGYGAGLGLLSMVCVAVKLITSAVTMLPF